MPVAGGREVPGAVGLPGQGACRQRAGGAGVRAPYGLGMVLSRLCVHPRVRVPLVAVCGAAGPAVPRGPGRAVLGQGVGAVFSRWRRASWEAGSSGR
ncbi:hypothetical protein GCM10023100_01550 [Actinocorallia cavernae]|uniref:Uncharacterized protein n=2 Tax=Actinomycetes TaxID=1760 RepID=A0ABP5ZBT4_9ACTN